MALKIKWEKIFLTKNKQCRKSGYSWQSLNLLLYEDGADEIMLLPDSEAYVIQNEIKKNYNFCKQAALDGALNSVSFYLEHCIENLKMSATATDLNQFKNLIEKRLVSVTHGWFDENDAEQESKALFICELQETINHEIESFTVEVTRRQQSEDGKLFVCRMNYDTVLEILADWVDTKSLIFLDSAFCCHRHRNTFVSMLKHSYFVTNGIHNKYFNTNFLNWCIVRQVKIRQIYSEVTTCNKNRKSYNCHVIASLIAALKNKSFNASKTTKLVFTWNIDDYFDISYGQVAFLINCFPNLLRLQFHNFDSISSIFTILRNIHTERLQELTYLRISSHDENLTSNIVNYISKHCGKLQFFACHGLEKCVSDSDILLLLERNRNLTELPILPRFNDEIVNGLVNYTPNLRNIVFKNYNCTTIDLKLITKLITQCVKLVVLTVDLDVIVIKYININDIRELYISCVSHQSHCQVFILDIFTELTNVQVIKYIHGVCTTLHLAIFTAIKKNNPTLGTLQLRENLCDTDKVMINGIFEDTNVMLEYIW